LHRRRCGRRGQRASGVRRGGCVRPDRAVGQIASKTGRSAAEAHAELAGTNPQGRLVQPDEVAQAVLWLCRRESAAITGQAIAVAGGEVM